MDERDQGQRWLMGQRISTSPSRYQSRQAAPPAAGGSSDRSSIQGTIGNQQMGTTYPWDSNAWQTLPDTQYGQHSGASSSQTSRAKRRRRSSSYDHRDSRQGYGGRSKGRRPLSATRKTAKSRIGMGKRPHSPRKRCIASRRDNHKANIEESFASAISPLSRRSEPLGRTDRRRAFWSKEPEPV
ncbi:hypothetical protein BKA70DRAFT_66552 [Coprinopsis sp. MPI-PUGE-AT-0042]|nr:hypothetical protein BKA70DRAFT_66552 [Coprinopsis sp. MPI-PUGE-AT-0042]